MCIELHKCCSTGSPYIIGDIYEAVDPQGRECHELDLKLAQYTTGKAGDRAGFLTYSAIIHEITQLEEERQTQRALADALDEAITTVALQLENSESNPHFQELQQEALRARDQVEKLVIQI